MERRQVFISYVEEDGELARALARELRTLGHSSWTYEEDGIGGVSYLVQVHDAIDACETFVLLASLTSVRSHQLIREVEHAHESQKVIVPVRVDHAATIRDLQPHPAHGERDGRDVGRRTPGYSLPCSADSCHDRIRRQEAAH